MIQGQTKDEQGRCVHWSGPTDVVANRFDCCDGFWACKACHDEAQDHVSKPATAWFSTLCGVCKQEIPRHVLPKQPDAYRCPNCDAAWNPGCLEHKAAYYAPSSMGQR